MISAINEADVRSLRWELTPPPRLDETLASMVFRASLENVHGSTKIILHELGQPTPTLTALPSIPGIGDGKLAKILRLPEEIVLRATHALRQDSTSALTMMDFFGAEIPEGYRYASFRRVSPLSLQAGNYDRAVHSLWPIQYAPSTMDQITETCLNPDCGGRLTWHRAASVAHCGRCGADQREFRTNMAPDFDREPLALMAALVDPDTNDQSILSLMPERFRGNSRGSLFMLGVLASRMEYRLGQKALGERDQSGRKICASGLAVGGRALQNWDDYIDGVIQRERELGHPLKDASRVLQELRPLAKTGAAGKALFVEATSKFVDHFCNFHDRLQGSRNRRVNERWARVRDAAKILNVDNRRIALLRNRGILVPVETYKKKRNFDIYSLDRILEIRRAIDDSVPLAKLKWHYAIPLVVIEDLIRNGLIKVQDDPAVCLLRGGPRVMRAGVDELIEKITRKAKRLDGNGREWFPIITSLAQIGGRPKPWARLISRLLESGEPIAYSGSYDRFNFRAIRVHESTVDGLIRETECEPQAAIWDSVTRARWTDEEASIYLNCPDAHIPALAEAGRLSRGLRDEKNGICSISAQEFGFRYISRREISAKGFDPMHVEQSLRAEASLSNVLQGAFFDRRSFESLDFTGMRQSRNLPESDSGRAGNPLQYMFSELSDSEWHVIRHRLRLQILRGGEAVARAAFNGMLWYAITGKSFKKMPGQYGNPISVQQRFYTMNRKLQWQPIFQELCRNRAVP